MMIKGMDGNTEHVTSQAQGNLNTFLGGAGTFLGLLNGGAQMMGFGGNGGYGRNANYGYATGIADPNSRFVTKGEMDLVQQLIAKDQTISQQNSTIAIKESENYTDKKLVEVTSYVDGKINRLADKVDGYYHEQQGFNAQQMAYNAAANANIDVLKSQTAALMGVTKMVVPSANVCDTGCDCGCR